MVKKFKKETLEKMSVKELRGKCKSFGIKVYTHTRAFKKEELIEKLLQVKIPVVNESDSSNSSKEEENKVLEVKTISNNSENVEGTNAGNTEQNEPKTRSFDYSRMSVGQFIAFRYKRKADTAKIYAINRKQRLVKVETKLGTRYMVPYERILWVKLKKEELWPKAVFMELKGHNKCNWEGVDDEPHREDKRECIKIIQSEE